MTKHLLLNEIFKYPHRDIKKGFLDCKYNDLSGYWEYKSSSMIMNKQFPKPNTKKADIETGEDLKGE